LDRFIVFEKDGHFLGLVFIGFSSFDQQSRARQNELQTNGMCQGQTASTTLYVQERRRVHSNCLVKQSIRPSETLIAIFQFAHDMAIWHRLTDLFFVHVFVW